MNAIIVGVDGSESAKAAAKQAAELAVSLGAPLHIVSAIPKKSSRTVKADGESWHVDSVTEAEQLLAGLAKELDAGSNEITTSAASGDPAEVVLAEAARLDAAFIVVGNRRMQGAKRVLGAVANDIAHHAPCHVLIAKTT